MGFHCAPPATAPFAGIVRDRLFARIKSRVGRAVAEFAMIEEGDRIAVGVSGGKDSWTLLHILEELRRRAPVRFTLVAINVDSGYPGYRADAVAAHLSACGFEFAMQPTNAYEIMREKKDPADGWCSFCARLRRGFLATAAERAGCNKIALGHHLDDFAETLLLNLFYGGALSAMSANYETSDGRFRILRPLVHVEETDIVEFSKRCAFPIVCCACPVCGTFDAKRQRMKRLVASLAEEIPNLRANIDGALGNIRLDRLLTRDKGKGQ